MEEPIYSPFFGVLGASSAMVFSAMGAAYGTAKSGTGIAAMSVMRPELIMKSIIPVVMAGIIAIYGVVVAVLIAGQLKPAPEYTLYKYVAKNSWNCNVCLLFWNASTISRIFCRFLKLTHFVLFQGLRTSWRWFGSRSQWFGGRLRYRHSGRRGREGDSTTASTLRGNDSDPHFRRGSGSLWSDCGHLPIRKISQEHPLDSIARAWRCICLCRYARSLLFQELSERSACARVSQCFDCWLSFKTNQKTFFSTLSPPPLLQFERKKKIKPHFLFLFLQFNSHMKKRKNICRQFPCLFPPVRFTVLIWKLWNRIKIKYCAGCLESWSEVERM